MAGAVEIKDNTSNVRLSLNAQGAVNINTIAPIDVQGTVTATPSGTQTVAGTVDVGNTVTVAGTVTATPTGTQTVAGTVTTVPSGTQTVTGTVVATPSGTQTVAGTVATYSTANPAILGAYVFSIPDLSGVVAANNFASLFNPVTSLNNLHVTTIGINSTTVGAASETAPMRGYRITTATGGTLQTNSTAVAKFRTADPDTLVEIRTANPTVTLGAPLFNSPAALNGNVSPTPPHTISLPDGTGSFILAPGEGIVFRTTAGDVDQRWSITFAWAEVLIV